MVFVGILALFIYTGINFYIGWNGSIAVFYTMPDFPMALYWVIFWLVAFSYLIGRTPLSKNPIGRFLKVVGSYYFGCIEFLVLLLPIANVLAWFLNRSGCEPAFYVPILTVAVIAILAVIFIRGLWNAWTPVVRTYETPISKRTGDMKELRMAVVSDLHLGNIVGKRHLRKMVKMVEEMNPDIVLLPGDVIDEVIEPFKRNNMAEVLKELHAPFGTYAVLGNHEYYGNHIEEYVEEMSKISIPVLQDGIVCIEDLFYIVGRKDKTAEAKKFGGRKEVSELVEGLDKSKLIVMMDHQPYDFAKALEAGVDILLCGHTHRGQFIPNHWITKKVFEKDWGYLRKDTLHVIVSSGYGTWGPPIRLGSRSEIVEVIVRI